LLQSRWALYSQFDFSEPTVEFGERCVSPVTLSCAIISFIHTSTDNTPFWSNCIQTDQMPRIVDYCRWITSMGLLVCGLHSNILLYRVNWSVPRDGPLGCHLMYRCDVHASRGAHPGIGILEIFENLYLNTHHPITHNLSVKILRPDNRPDDPYSLIPDKHIRINVYIFTHTVSHCLTPSHTVSHCPTLSHTVPHCPTLSHTVPHCPTLSHTVPHCPTLSHTVIFHTSTYYTHISRNNPLWCVSFHCGFVCVCSVATFATFRSIVVTTWS